MFSLWDIGVRVVKLICLFAAPYNLIMLFHIISFSNELSVVTLISQLPFIEREIGFNEPVDPNRSVRANE